MTPETVFIVQQLLFPHVAGSLHGGKPADALAAAARRRISVQSALGIRKERVTWWRGGGEERAAVTMAMTG